MVVSRRLSCGSEVGRLTHCVCYNVCHHAILDNNALAVFAQRGVTCFCDRRLL